MRRIVLGALVVALAVAPAGCSRNDVQVAAVSGAETAAAGEDEGGVPTGVLIGLGVLAAIALLAVAVSSTAPGFPDTSFRQP